MLNPNITVFVLTPYILSECALLMWQVMNTKDKRDLLLPGGLGSVVMAEHHMLT